MVRVRFAQKIDPRVQAFLRQRWLPEHGYEVATAMDRYISKKNMPDVILYGQSGWKPLSEKHVERKQREARPLDIWKYTGRTVKALLTHMRIKSFSQKRLLKQASVPYNQGGIVTLEIQVLPPAAGGYFAQNNEAREILRILPHHERGLAFEVLKAYKRILRKAGIAVRGVIASR